LFKNEKVRRDKGMVSRFFSPRTRQYVLFSGIPANQENVCLARCGVSSESAYAVSSIRLVSIPEQGVRVQRPHGAVPRDELDAGAAVSDERQYQFSHLASLWKTWMQSRIGGLDTAYELCFQHGLVHVRFIVTGGNADGNRRVGE
jgi:hypothetical protein